MKKIKVIFPDGSIGEVNESDLKAALAAGAKLYNEKTAAATSKKVAVVFPDGSDGEIDEKDMSAAAAAGVKKKEATAASGATGSGFQFPSTSTDVLTFPKESDENFETYNRSFEQALGIPASTPNQYLGPDAKEVERKKYVDYKSQEPILSSFVSKLRNGTVKPEELQSLYNNPVTKEFVKNIVQEYAPTQDGKLPSWEDVSKNIAIKNRNNYVLNESGFAAQLDQDITNDLQNVKAIQKVSVSGGTGGAAANISESNLPQINLADTESYGPVLEQLKEVRDNPLANIVGRTDSKQIADRLIKSLEYKIALSDSKRELLPEIAAIQPRIKEAVTENLQKSTLIPSADFGVQNYQDKIDATAENFARGLQYIKSAQPNRYLNIVRALNEKGKIGDTDFEQVSAWGQEVRNLKLTRDGATNHDLINKETEYDYQGSSYQTQKARYAAIIAEEAKKQGIKNIARLQEKTVRELVKSANAKGNKLTDESIIRDLVADEKSLGTYIAIPKAGVLPAFVTGIIKPIGYIEQTVKDIAGTPAEAYLRTQRHDIGWIGQQVADDEGQYDYGLPSIRNKIWHKAVDGAGQFVTQVALAKTAGAPFRAAGQATAQRLGQTLSAAERAAFTNYPGTFVSTFLQEYGSAYEQGLIATGDPQKASVMAGINSTAASAFELILPDAKLADKIGQIWTKGFSGDIADIIRRGVKEGIDVSTLKREAAPFIQRAVSQTINVGTQEVSEELGTQVANYITEVIFSPRTAEDRDLAVELLETAKATAIQMLIPSVLGGGGGAMNRDMTVAGLHAAALNFDEYKKALNRALIDGNMTQQEHDLGVKMINTHRKSIDDAPPTTVTGKEIPMQMRLEYAYQNTNVKFLNEQLKNTDDEVKKELLQEKITKAQEIQRSIAMPDGKVELKDILETSVANTEKQLTEELGEEKVTVVKKDIDSLIESKIIRPEHQQFAQDFPLTFFKNISQQANLTTGGISSRQAIVDLYGEPIVAQAEELFPIAPQDTRPGEIIQQTEVTPEMQASIPQAGRTVQIGNSQYQIVGEEGDKVKVYDPVQNITVRVDKSQIPLEKTGDALSRQLMDRYELSQEEAADVATAKTPEEFKQKIKGYLNKRTQDTDRVRVEMFLRESTQGPAQDTAAKLEAIRVENQEEINRLVGIADELIGDQDNPGGVEAIAQQYDKDKAEGLETEITKSVDALLSKNPTLEGRASQGQGATTALPLTDVTQEQVANVGENTTRFISEPKLELDASAATSVEDAKSSLESDGGVVWQEFPNGQRMEVGEAGGPVAARPTDAEHKGAPGNERLHNFGFGRYTGSSEQETTGKSLFEVLSGDGYTTRQRGMAAAYIAALRLLNNERGNFIGKLFARAANKSDNPRGRIRLIYNSHPQAPIMSASSEGFIVLNAEKLGRRVEEFGGETRFLNWLEAALQEEVTHLATYKVATPEELQQVADEMTDEQRQAIKDSYQGELNDIQIADEFIRQIFQDRVWGTTTEQLKPKESAISKVREVVRKLVAFIKNTFTGEQNPTATDIIRRLDNFIRNKPVIRVQLGPGGQATAIEGRTSDTNFDDELDDLWNEFHPEDQGAKPRVRFTADEWLWQLGQKSPTDEQTERELEQKFRAWEPVNKENVIVQDVRETHQNRTGQILPSADYERLQRDKFATDASMDALVNETRSRLGNNYLNFLMRLIHDPTVRLEVQTAITQSLQYRQGLLNDVINNTKMKDKTLATRVSDVLMIRRSYSDDLTEDQENAAIGAMGQDGQDLKAAKDILKETMGSNDIPDEVQEKFETEQPVEPPRPVRKPRKETKKQLERKAVKEKYSARANFMKQVMGAKDDSLKSVIDNINQIARKCK